MKPKTISLAISGGGGFIGTSLVKAFYGNPGIRELRVLYETAPEIPHFGKPFSPVVGDLQDSKVAQKLIEGTDAVIHLANRGFPSDTIPHPAALVSENLLSTGNLLEAMKEKRLSKILYASSGGAIYRNQTVSAGPFLESDQTEFRSAYALLKISCENLFGFYEKHHGFKPVILRISNPFGMGQYGRERQGFFGVAFQKILSGEAMPIWGSLDICKDFVYIQDVIRAFENFLFASHAPAGVFNIGSGKGSTLREGIKLVEETTNRKLKLEILPGKVSDSNWTVLNIKKTKTTVGWSPKFSLEEGLRHMWEEILTEQKSKTRAA